MEVSSLYKGQTVKKEKTGNKVVRQTVFYKKENDYYDVLTLKKYTSKEEYVPYGGIYVDESSLLQITEEDILKMTGGILVSDVNRDRVLRLIL